MDCAALHEHFRSVVTVTRFAPSPNGLLHIGHAYAAMQAHDIARSGGGRFLLRIEDIDGTRSRGELVDAIVEDLRWLGLTWDGHVTFQSQRLDLYEKALARLQAMDLLYPCFCSRADIARAVAAEPVQVGPDGPVYPGTCRALHRHERATRMAQEPHSLRIDMARAVSLVGKLTWQDAMAGVQHARPDLFGDVVLARKDAPASYHLAVVVDDADQHVSDVVRGHDLFAATHVHRLLQDLLGLPAPLYRHHGLLAGRDGRKLSKSENAPSLATLRQGGTDGPALLAALRNNRFPAGISLIQP